MVIHLAKMICMVYSHNQLAEPAQALSETAKMSPTEPKDAMRLHTSTCRTLCGTQHRWYISHVGGEECSPKSTNQGTQAWA